MSVYLVAPVLGDTVDGERGACGDVNDGGEPGGSPSAPARRGSEYAELLRLVRAEGLLDRRLGYYRARIALTVALSRRVGRCSSGSGRRGGSWSSRRSWRSCSSSSASSATTQAIGRCSAPEATTICWASLCADLLIGLSYSWWIEKHNRHHANPNHVDRDPDIDAGGVVFTKAQARARRSRIGRWVAHHQAVLFFPMLLFEGAALHVAGIRALHARPAGHTRRVDAVLLSAHIVGYFAAVFLVLPPAQAVVAVRISVRSARRSLRTRRRPARGQAASPQPHWRMATTMPTCVNALRFCAQLVPTTMEELRITTDDGNTRAGS